MALYLVQGLGTVGTVIVEPCVIQNRSFRECEALLNDGTAIVLPLSSIVEPNAKP